MAKVPKNKAYNYEDDLLFPRIDTFCGNNQYRIFQITLGLSLLFGFLLFDPLISEGGDDSGYLLAAKRFLDGKAFPTFHGSFYSVFLAMVMKITGFHLILFKALSLIFLLGQHFFLFKTLRHRISPFLLSALLLLISINSGLLYFGSQTYTEAFFMFLQSLFLYLFIGFIIVREKITLKKWNTWLNFLALGFLLFALSTTRNIGIVALLAAILILLLEKRWLQALLTILSFLIIKLPWSFYKSRAWGITESDVSSQLEIMLRKYPYNPTLGTENLGGLFVRFFENIRIYLSGVFLNETGFSAADSISGSYFIAILLVIILITGLILAFLNRHKTMQIIFVYLAISLLVLFFSVSQLWSQSRLIIAYLPLLLLSIIWTLATLGKAVNQKWISYLSIAIIAVSFIRTFPASLKTGSVKREVAQNYSKDKFYGYTPDMVNFLKASAWSAKNVPVSQNIASRKASMSFIYGGGREFYPIHNLPYRNVDSVLNNIEMQAQNCVIIDESEFSGKPSQDVYALKPMLHALVSSDSIIYGIYLEDKSENRMDSILSILGLTGYTNTERFQNQVLSRSSENMALLPDQMLKQLKDNNVYYIISANLRLDSSRKSDQTINTIKRYMASINAKYPGIFRKVKSFGRPDDEPAHLIQLNYELVNF